MGSESSARVNEGLACERLGAHSTKLSICDLNIPMPSTSMATAQYRIAIAGLLWHLTLTPFFQPAAYGGGGVRLKSCVVVEPAVMVTSTTVSSS
jgi:hypothetical protein